MEPDGFGLERVVGRGLGDCRGIAPVVWAGRVCLLGALEGWVWRKGLGGGVLGLMALCLWLGPDNGVRGGVGGQGLFRGGAMVWVVLP